MKLESQALRAHPFLSLIPRFTLRRLLSKAPAEEYPKGTVIFRQGAPCDALYLIISGRCESRRLVGGVEEVEEILGPGDTLGDRELLHNEPYRSTLTVATDSVLVRLAAADLRQTFLKNPAIAGRVSQSIAGRLQALRDSQARSTGRVRRVVSLLSVSPRIDDDAVAERLAAALHRLGDHEVLLVRLAPAQGGKPTVNWQCVTTTLKGGFCFQSEIVRNAAGFAELRLDVDGETGRIAPLVSHLGANFDFVILHAHPGIPVPATLECVVQSDWTYVLLSPQEKVLFDHRLLVRQAAAQSGGAHVRIKPVIYLADERGGAEFARSLRRSGTPPHAWVRGFPVADEAPESPDRKRNFEWHIRSLAREIAGCRIGLALSSGGAKGLCHIGVLQVLEEHGIEIDMVAGASMGAYVGAVWTSGHSGAECERFAREIPEGRMGLLALVQPEFPPRRGFLKTRRVANRLRRSVGDVRFSELRVPLRVVATYLDTLERVVFSTGEVASAVEASIAIPGICVPVVLDGEKFVDGGIVDPLPVDVLREAGIERIIAVNTIPTPERLRYCLLAERNSPSGLGPPEAGFLGRHLNYFASGNVLDTMFRSITGAQTRLAEAACLDADVVLRPIASDGHWHDFANPGKYIAIGRKVAEDRIEEIQALVSRRKEEPVVEPHAAPLAA